MVVVKALVAPIVSGLLVLAAVAQQPGEVERAVDSLCARWSEPDTPGVAVAVVRDGVTLLARAYGAADLECGTKLATTTRLDAASLAKSFTAFAVLTLEAEGALELDDSLRKHLPELPEPCAPITLRHLLHHTSGLRDWGGLVQLQGGRMEDSITTRAVLELVRRQRELEFVPGSEYAYRNVGYVLLAEVVARVSGKSFRAWTRERIFEPLGMTSAVFRDDPGETLSDSATSYRRVRKEFRRQVDLAALPGPGSLAISIEDLARWLGAVQTRALGAPAIWERVFERGRLADARELPYAAGWIAAEYEGRAIWTHSGGWAGFRADMLLVPSERLAVAVLAGQTGIDASALARRVLALHLVGPRPEPPAPVDTEVAQSLLARCAGRYWLEGERTLTITILEGKLVARLSGDLPIALHPESADTFAYRVVDARVRFHGAGEAPAERATFWQGAYAQTAERLPEQPWTPSDLDEFRGRYLSDELGKLLEVELTPEGLRVPFVRREALALVPIARDRFAGRGTSVKLRFVRDAEGRVVALRASLPDAHDVAFARL